MIMHALIAEIKGKEWTAPPLPLEYPSVNSNPIKECAEEEVRIQEHRHECINYSGMAVLGVSGALRLAAWHVREMVERRSETDHTSIQGSLGVSR